MRDLFAEEPARFSSPSFEEDGMLLDISREKLDPAALDALIASAEAAGLESAREALFTGQWRNATEDRGVSHPALRDGCGDAVAVDGADVMPDARRVRDAMLGLSEDVRTGRYAAMDGAPVDRVAAPVVWGAAGTNAQHSFFQMLHQGRDGVHVDFLLAAEPVDGTGDHHSTLGASALAQARALAFGDPEATDPQRQFPGDRPSTMLLYRRLDPETLGKLIALWEHKIFVQGVIRGLNAFDQFGVELGKRMTADLEPALTGKSAAGHDSATTGAIQWLRRPE